MRMLRRLLTPAVIASSLLLPATPALASGADVIRDCNDHGHLTKEYSQKEYRDALAQMPADIKQYTDCEGLIRRAQRGDIPSSDPSLNTSNPFGSAPPNEVAQAKKDIAVARKSGGTPQRVAGDLVYPGALSFTKASAAVSDLPTPLLVLIGLIIAGALAAAVQLYRSRRHGHGGA